MGLKLISQGELRTKEVLNLLPNLVRILPVIYYRNNLNFVLKDSVIEGCLFCSNLKAASGDKNIRIDLGYLIWKVISQQTPINDLQLP